MDRQEVPPPKFSADFIDRKFKLEQLLRNKKYSVAKTLKEGLDRMEEEETQAWVDRWAAQKDRHRDLLARKQRNEYEALKTRLEKSINSRLKVRMNEYDKLLQRIQNLQNELMTKQSLHFAKISSANQKLLAKYTVGNGAPFGVLEGALIRVLSQGTQEQKCFPTGGGQIRPGVPRQSNRERLGGPGKYQRPQKEPGGNGRRPQSH